MTELNLTPTSLSAFGKERHINVDSTVMAGKFLLIEGITDREATLVDLLGRKLATAKILKVNLNYLYPIA